MKQIVFTLLVSALLLLGCAGYSSPPPSANGQQPPAGSNQQPAASPPAPPGSNNPTGPVACSMEAKICPDGTPVGRTGPNCEFAACPPSGNNSPPPAPPPPAPGTAPVASVEISGFAFSPSALAVAKGTTVTWTNNDAVGHTITSSSFNSGTMGSGGTFSFTFTQDGTYDYICSIHPSMKGKITVTG
ncbi:MAG: cupredoxin family copper-binding protein [Candidatus Micrarchaeia archaeon]